jgi:hypothetical protein
MLSSKIDVKKNLLYKEENMSIKYYNRLEATDKKIEEIANWRDNKIGKYASKVMDKASKKATKALKKLGKTIPEEVKRGNF